MAEGRMLKRVIATSPRLAALKTDTNRLIYTWLIPFLDVEGRMEADPRIVKGMVAPLLDHISTRVIAAALHDMQDHGLILLYSANGNNYLQLERFARHQRLRMDREAPSNIPPPTPGGLREDSGITPGVSPEDSGITPTQVKLSKVKLSKVNARARELPVDNSLPEPLPVDMPSETTPMEKEDEKPLSKNTHGERWMEKQGSELELLMTEIKDRYGDKYHQQCYIWLQTYFNQANPDAVLYCLRRLIQERLAGKQIPVPGRWLESVIAVENAKHEARLSEQEHQERKAEEIRDVAKLISGIGIMPARGA